MSRILNASTKAELEEQLQRLNPRWWAGLPGKMALNAYACQECKGTIVTVDVDSGVTPSHMGCKVSEDCLGVMVSSGYPSSPPPQDLLETSKVFEWYRPEAGPLGLFHELQEVDEYIRRGGLLLRERAKNDGDLG